MGMMLDPISTYATPLPEQQGRVTDASIQVYDSPSFKGKGMDKLWKDMVFEIMEATIGDAEPAHNRVWYKIGTDRYVHSGSVQPVRTQVSEPVQDIPSHGALAEVTVPFTDSHWKADRSFPVAYRFYYETTHWVKHLLYDRNNDPWYQLLDDKWDISYFVPARHLRIFPVEELTPINQELPSIAKRIEVRLAEQVVIAYELETPVFMTRTATGARFSNGNFATPTGRHITNHKRPYRHMAQGNLAYNGYDLPGVPWVTYITESGISFHGTFWHNNFGRPRSHGCINLTPQAAKWIYRWTSPIVPPNERGIFESYGTVVDVM